MSVRRFARNGRPAEAAEATFGWQTGLVASGEGWFETMRGEAGRWMFVEAHLDRLARGVAASGLDGGAARAAAAATLAAIAADAARIERLRLVVTPAAEAPFGWQATAEADRYEPPHPQYVSGISLASASFPHPQLGRFGKSVSYHWSAIAQREAAAAGADEALLWRDGAVAEAARATLLWCCDGRWFTPEAEGLLESVTLAQLEASGWGVVRARLEATTLAAADGMVLVSSLRLAVPVVALDGRAVANCADAASAMRAALLRRHAEAS